MSMAERICPHCSAALAPVEDDPDAGVCDTHGEFRFIDRMALDVGDH